MMRRFDHLQLTLSIMTLAVLPLSRIDAQAFTFSAGTLTYSENFDSMGASGTTFATGWTSTDATMVAGDGSSNAGGVYNVGSAGSDERAFGSLASGSVIPIFGTSFANATGATIGSLLFSGVMEQWRAGSSTAANEFLPFEFSFDATGLSDGTWTRLANFDLNEKLTGSTASSAVDGNAPENRTALNATANVAWNNATTMWIRWSDANDAGNDGLYAIDNFALTVTTAANPLYWDLNGATAGLGGPVGTWDSSTLNWTVDSTGASPTQTFNSNNAAHFTGTAGTVQVAPGGVVAGGGMTFETEGYVVAGGVVTLGAAPVAVNHSNGASTINSVIAGSNGLTKSGIGTLTLNGTNTFTGTITISGGTLRIAAENNLGNPGNDLVLSGGAIEPLNDMVLDIGRELRGAGAIVIASGRTLTVNGLVNLSALTLPRAGTLMLSGTGNALGTLNISEGATISGSAPIAVTTAVTTSDTSATSTWNAPMSLPAGTPQFTIPSGLNPVDFIINGIISGAGRLLKLGTGTLRIAGNNGSWSGSVRFGVAGTGATPGGRIIIAHPNALGGSASVQLQFNDGTLEAETPMTGANAIPIGLSIGPGITDGAIFAGAEMEFGGAVQLFKPAGTVLDPRITVNNKVTFSGPFEDTAGTGASNLVIISGTGELVIANANNTVPDRFSIEGPTVTVNGALAASTVAVGHGKLRGTGAVLELFIGDGDAAPGILAPGNGIGTLTATSVSFDAEAVFELEINSTLGTADQLRVSGDVNLGNGFALLSVTDLGSGALAQGTSFTIIDNQSSTSGTSGFFEERPDLSLFTLGANLFEIDYRTGSDLNDVVLRVIPEPTCATLLIAVAPLTALRRLRKRICERGTSWCRGGSLS